MSTLVSYGSTRPNPRLLLNRWAIPLGITSTVDDDGIELFVGYEAKSLTLFAHDIDAAIAECDLPDDIDIAADRHAAICHGIRLQRAKEYPPASEYLDGVAKSDQEQIDAYIAACLAVKEKYPFPDL
jgi:hypothetical protein